ncbi:hypothetical protein [Plasmodium yoelii yoelii]
MEFYF